MKTKTSRLIGLTALLYVSTLLPYAGATPFYTYESSDGDIQQYASTQDVADANGSSVGLTLSGYDAVANAGSQWVLWNSGVADVRSYNSYSDFLSNSNFSDYSLNENGIAINTWEGLGSDGTQWVLYDGTNDGDGNSEFRVFPTFTDFLSNSNSATYQPSNYAFEDIDSDGTAWYMYDEGLGDVLKYTSLDDMTSNNLAQRVRITGTASATGLDGFAVQVVPEPGTALLLLFGSLLFYLRRCLSRPS